MVPMYSPPLGHTAKYTHLLGHNNIHSVSAPNIHRFLLAMVEIFISPFHQHQILSKEYMLQQGMSFICLRFPQAADPQLKLSNVELLSTHLMKQSFAQFDKPWFLFPGSLLERQTDYKQKSKINAGSTITNNLIEQVVQKGYNHSWLNVLLRS